jgi:hypothetical protein
MLPGAMMTRLALLLPLVLAACATTEGGPSLGVLLGRSEQPEAPAPLPPQVIAALPAGVPSSVVTLNADGCYLITLERTDPPEGYPLTDAAGNRVCEGGAVSAEAPTSEAATTPTPA